MLDEHVELLERALVQQQVQTLARRQLALAVLARNPALAAAKTRLSTALLQLFKDVLGAGRREVANDRVQGPGLKSAAPSKAGAILR
jgi:hypothetical protein